MRLMQPSAPLPRRAVAAVLAAAVAATGAALAVAASSPAARAATTADLFRVDAVPVDATAANAVQARQQALEAGQREGLRRLLSRLTLPEDRTRLPQVEAAAVEGLVESYQVASEKVGPTRYLASLNLAYAPDGVRRLLRDAGVPFIERPLDPVLVVPVLTGPGGAVVDLWGDANPWRAAWNERGAASPLAEIRLPLGDAGDVASLAPESLEDPAALARLGERYGVSTVATARARPIPSATPPGDAGSTSGGNATGGDEAGAAAVALTGVELGLEVRRTDEQPGADEAGAGRPAGKPALRETLRAGTTTGTGTGTGTAAGGNGGEAGADLLARAVDRVVAALEADLKRTRLTPEAPPATLQAGVLLADLSSWVQIRRGLETLPEVRSVSVDRLGRGAATITIAYVGGLEGLQGSLAGRGLALVQENERWQLRQAGVPGAFPAPSPASPATR